MYSVTRSIKLRVKTMTRKDYILIANALHRNAADLAAYAEMSKTPAEVHSFLVYSVLDALAGDNPRFDRERFAEACGVE